MKQQKFIMGLLLVGVVALIALPLAGNNGVTTGTPDPGNGGVVLPGEGNIIEEIIPEEPPVAEVPDEPVVEPPVAEVPDESVIEPPVAEVPDEPVVEPPVAEVPDEPVVEPPVAEIPDEPVVTPPVVVEPPVAEVTPPVVVEPPVAEVTPPSDTGASNGNSSAVEENVPYTSDEGVRVAFITLLVSLMAVVGFGDAFKGKKAH